MNKIKKLVNELTNEIELFDIDDKIKVLNFIRKKLHKISPFAEEPVDCVQWIKLDDVIANKYNPNIVAPPEMNLLEHSIREDGYTQPIVAWPNNNKIEVIDGFHRNRVGREIKDIKKRIHGYLPISIVNPNRTKKSDRIASTIRHNRARGKHTVEAMSDIILELKNRNWKDKRIAKELGMDQDEILRLCQITGLAGLFSDQEFSKSWDIEENTDDFTELDDDIALYDDEEIVRTVNTSDKNRIFHKWDKWECYKSGFYKTINTTNLTPEEVYLTFFSKPKEFEKYLNIIITEWKYSCEHYLTNSAMNRIAWLGQAAICLSTGLSSKYIGWAALNLEQQEENNRIALIHLNKWLKNHNLAEVNLEIATGNGRQAVIY